VSENDDCQCAGTTKVAVKFMGSNVRRGKLTGILGKQTQRVCVCVTCWGRLFQVRAAATGKA